MRSSSAGTEPAGYVYARVDVSFGRLGETLSAG